jgi:hypothetical protein
VSRNYLNSEEFRRYDQAFCERMDRHAAALKEAKRRQKLYVRARARWRAKHPLVVAAPYVRGQP